MRNAIGFKPAANLLKGMKGSSAYGEALAGASNLALEATEGNAKMGLEERNLENERSQKKNQINAKDRSSSMEYGANQTKSQIDKGKTHSAAKATNLHRNRKNHWDMKNTLLQGLYT